MDVSAEPLSDKSEQTAHHDPKDPYTGSKLIKKLRVVYANIRENGQFVVDSEDRSISDKDSFEQETIDLVELLKQRNSVGGISPSIGFDLKFKVPTRIVFFLAAPAWIFGDVEDSGEPGFRFIRNSTQGGRSDNDTLFELERVAFLDQGKAITLVNSHENDGANAPNRKYEYKLEIDVLQNIAGEQVGTRLVIDPAIENEGDD